MVDARIDSEQPALWLRKWLCHSLVRREGAPPRTIQGTPKFWNALSAPIYGIFTHLEAKSGENSSHKPF